MLQSHIPSPRLKPHTVGWGGISQDSREHTVCLVAQQRTGRNLGLKDTLAPLQGRCSGSLLAIWGAKLCRIYPQRENEKVQTWEAEVANTQQEWTETKYSHQYLWKVRIGSVSEGAEPLAQGFKKFGGNDHKVRGRLRNRDTLKNGKRAGGKAPGAGLVKLANTYWMLHGVGQGAKSFRGIISFSPSNNISDVDSSSSLQEESYVERLSKLPRAA